MTMRLPHAVLLGIILLAGFADQPRIIQFGSVSALAALMAVQCCIVWCVWLAKPWAPSRQGAVLGFILFSAWVLGTLFWTRKDLIDPQPLLVFLLILGLVLLSYREVHRNPDFAGQLGTALDAMSLIATVLCILRIALGDNDVESATSDRSVVIVMLVGIARQLAMWQCGQSRRLIAAGIMVLVIVASLSRMASLVALLLFPIAVMFGASRSKMVIRTAQVLIAGIVLAGSLLMYEPMYDRFFGTLKLGEVSAEDINSSGRTEMWEDIIDSFHKHPWFGQGPGSTRPYTDKPGMFHPHCDYLLLSHDYGVFGLGLWMSGIIATMVQFFRYVRRAAGASVTDGPGYPICLTGLLSLVVLVLSMATDNTVTYAFVMAPISILIGSGLALAGKRQRKSLRHYAPTWAAQPNEGGATCKTS